MPIDPNAPDWLRGYSDGINARPHDKAPTQDYHDGWLTGDAERDMPPPDDPAWKEDAKRITVADAIEFLRYLRDDCKCPLAVILDSQRYSAVAPLASTTAAIITGRIGDRDGCDQHWRYLTIGDAMQAMVAWVEAGAEGEPAQGRGGR